MMPESSNTGIRSYMTEIALKHGSSVFSSTSNITF